MLAQKNGSDLIDLLSHREISRDRYWQKQDKIIKERLLWRAQMFRHLVHLLPGQSILELGCGNGFFTQQLHRVSRGESPITSVSFQLDSPKPEGIPDSVEFLNISSLPGSLEGRLYDFIVAIDLLDKANCSWVLQKVYKLLKPGGQIVFYETNPWNIFIRSKSFINKVLGKPDRQRLLSRSRFYELISELGFIKVFSVYNDFVYPLFTPSGVWMLRNLSILLENLPYIRTLASSILVHAQKPPQFSTIPNISLCEHEQLRSALSVVVPCHNEEMNIEPLVTRLVNFYGEYIHEIILVDDNSKDSTSEVIKKLAQQYPFINPVFRKPPNGVGRAIMDGYKVATGKYILSMDCDFQHLLPELRDIFDVAVSDGYDVVIGSRFSRFSVLLNYPFQKILANRAFHFLARTLFRTRIRDLTNNLKLIRREVAEKLELTQPGFAINAETGLLPVLMDFNVREIPISWINRTPEMGVSSFKLLKVGGGYWKVLIKLLLKLIFNKNSYYPKVKLQKSTKKFKSVENEFTLQPTGK